MSTCLDGNEAVARVAHRLSEVIAIYPITPSSTMAELCDEWSAAALPNLWGRVPSVIEMQSEAGAAGTLHGALQAGALATSFTSSQGLLLMIPNLYKIAGELTPCVIHVAARTLATHALSIFGDHADVMAVRQTGVAMLCAGSVQEAHDFAAVAHAATLEARIPFLHFFDGFRTSHEVHDCTLLGDDDLRALLSETAIAAHRARALSPERPVIRGTAHNPDTYFQAAEAANPWYDRCADVVRAAFARFEARTGRSYGLFDWSGHPQAERAIVILGSGADAARAAAERLNAAGERVGVLAVRLYRPFDARAFAATLPPSVRVVAALDRTREPGAVADPLHLDVTAALAEAADSGWRPGPAPRVVGGRYGLSSKEFTPAMAKTVFDELTAKAPRRRFTIGIVDDVTQRSLAWDPAWDREEDGATCAIFHGLGSDGSVGAAKNVIKIVGEEAGLHAQGYFVYDSKKSGSTTASHLRFAPRPIRAPWLLRCASYLSFTQARALEQGDALGIAAPGGCVVLNTTLGPERIWASLPAAAVETIRARGLRLHLIDASAVAAEVGLPGRVATVMQGAFFALSGLMPRETALAAARRALEKSFARRGEEVVRRNVAALEAAEARLRFAGAPPDAVEAPAPAADPLAEAPDFVRRVTAALMAGRGDALPVSAFPPDGTWPTDTARWERRAIAREIPVWEQALCIQCNKCALVCPHAAIRPQTCTADALHGAPAGFTSVPLRGGDSPDLLYTLQVAPDDCTGCGLCVAVCPAKSKDAPPRKAIEMAPAEEQRAARRADWEFFRSLPAAERATVRADNKGSQLLTPLFEFSGACAGCGETPYLKLLTQLWGDRLLVANATGCSSIYGGNLPTTPWAQDACGRGPAWANSLFEDNAEFGLGMRLALDASAARARGLLERLAARLPETLVDGLLGGAAQNDEAGVAAQRARVEELRRRLAPLASADGAETAPARELLAAADHLVRRTVWIVGGDGWAYDIGFGGLDHLFSTTADVNVLVMDTEVYSNTGGQQSKATPLGATARFASAGRAVGKKDLGLIAMSYGHVYVASVALLARDSQTVKALQEAESYPGPSLVIAHSPCIAHGYDLAKSPTQQRLAVESGMWPLYRFDPRRLAVGEPPLKLESGPLKASVADFMQGEARFRAAAQGDPARWSELLAAAERHAHERRAFYERMAELKLTPPAPASA